MTIKASFEVIQLLEQLLEHWHVLSRTPTGQKYCLHTRFPNLLLTPSEKRTFDEEQILREIKRIATPEEWTHLKEIAKDFPNQKQRIDEVARTLDQFFAQRDFLGAEAYVTTNDEKTARGLYDAKKRDAIDNIWREIKAALEHFDFQEAELHYAQIQPYLSNEKASLFNELVQAAKNRQEKEQRERFVASTIQTIQSSLEEYEFSRAQELFDQIRGEFSENEYHRLVQTQKRKQAKEKLISSIHSCLTQGKFATADELFLGTELLTTEEYLKIKIPYVRTSVERQYSTVLNYEQASALATPAQNLLVSARAGSGKTTVLACKTSLLIDHDKVQPDRILVMAFNKNAAVEIRERIRRSYGQPGFVNARTFHSLAFQLVRPQEKLLFDNKSSNITRAMTLFVQQLLKQEIRNPVFIDKAYTFFRKEMREIEQAGLLLDDEDYLNFRRNLRHVTLNGEKVKSAGEKFIADYLFEHDISYVYEQSWFWDSQIYRPDFSLYEQQMDFVIEHWGIDEHDPQKAVPADWTQTWDEYYEEMQRKRKFWSEKSIALIETSIRDLRRGREAFERILTSRLARAGIRREKLSKDALMQRIKEKDHTITRLAELFVQFIQRAKKQRLKPEDVPRYLQSYRPRDDRESVFLDLACRVYLEYEQELNRQRKIDFDDLMMLAIDRIHQTQGNCRIALDRSKSRYVRMNDLRWILIDEYQDFSELFHALIAAIQEYNPHVRIFCVGDDWQAINGFAGSDLRYFHHFTDTVKDGNIVHLLTNFRSQAKIVQAGNKLMRGNGRLAHHLPHNLGGDVHVEYVDDVWIELRDDKQNASQKKEDERFLLTQNSSNGKRYLRVIASKYLKRCYEIITAPENEGKTIAILNRTGWLDGVRLHEFRSKLSSCLIENIPQGTQDRTPSVQTAHKYKGLEADLVIILNVTNGSFPLIHPDNALFGFFGKTLVDAFEEEQRLFYVALTRAKKSLYLLTEKGRESVFLSRLS